MTFKRDDIVTISKAKCDAYNKKHGEVGHRKVTPETRWRVIDTLSYSTLVLLTLDGNHGTACRNTQVFKAVDPDA